MTEISVVKGKGAKDVWNVTITRWGKEKLEEHYIFEDWDAPTHGWIMFNERIDHSGPFMIFKYDTLRVFR
jgi:hypothetical protein